MEEDSWGLASYFRFHCFFLCSKILYIWKWKFVERYSSELLKQPKMKLKI